MARRPTTWQVLREVDELLADNPDWKPLEWNQHQRQTQFVNESAYRDKCRRKRDRDDRKRRG